MAEYIIRLTIEGPEGVQKLVVPPGVMTMGRQPGNEIHLNHQMVSRQHARLENKLRGCTLMDLGSANGTILNNERLTENIPYPLTDQAVIQIGPFTLLYEQTPIVVISAEPIAPVQPAEPDIPANVPPERVPAVGHAVQPPGHSDNGDSPQSMPPQRPPRPVAPDYSTLPPGMSPQSDRYLQYLPGIYQNEFMGRLLGMLEAIMAPIEWNIDNFDLYLDPKTAPPEFLPWLESWFGLPFDSTWSNEQKRMLIQEASHIYARRGTHWSLSRVLEIYTGVKPEIDDKDESLTDFSFSVKIPLDERQVKRELVENLINTYKPAHTQYTLSFTG